MPSALSTWMGRVCAGNGLAPPMRTPFARVCRDAFLSAVPARCGSAVVVPNAASAQHRATMERGAVPRGIGACFDAVCKKTGQRPPFAQPRLDT